MTIADSAFAAQLVTANRQGVRFDDPACLAAFASPGARPRPQEIHSLWV